MLNFNGPDDDNRFSVYHDGALAANAFGPRGGRSAAEDTRLVIGRSRVEANFGYSSIEVDELVLFNRALNATEIRMLST